MAETCVRFAKKDVCWSMTYRIIHIHSEKRPGACVIQEHEECTIDARIFENHINASVEKRIDFVNLSAITIARI